MKLTMLLLLMLTGAGLAQEINITDRRLVPFSELRESLDRFAPPGVTAFSEILFDIQKYQMIVGARDQLYRLSVRGLQELESVHWPPTPRDATLCEIKGQAAGDCRNYIRALHSRGDRLLACGTNAFQPQCTWRVLESLRTVLASESGVAVAPYSPRFNVTSVLTADGDIVAATPTDFSGLDPAVYRGAGVSGRAALRTSKYDTRLLREPQFVGSFETADFVYFVFREEAFELLNCGKRVVSRIGRICKNDSGDRRGVWTTFLKARLNCSVAGEYPFYLDEVQSIHYLDRHEVLYATFSAPENGLAGSAVCAFRLQDIQQAFDGPYRQLEDQPSGPQQRTPEERRHFQCGSDDAAVSETRRRPPTADAIDQALAFHAVQPNKLDPLLLLDGVSLSAVATDVITTKHHMAVHVIFVTDRAGTIRKLSVVPRSQKTCLVEVLQPFERPTTVLAMKLLREEGSLYLGTDSGLVRVPVQRCDRYTSEAACLAAQDPYCGWDALRQLCSPPPSRNPDVVSWRQLVTQCPDQSRPVDGAWTHWSDWQSCQQADGADSDMCQCRRRTCSQPAPANGGAPCRGLTTQVANCTRHGGWTGWSAWSACSHPCGVAVKSRRRSCTNPAPAYGGRPCVGEESQEIMCHSNPPCPSRTALPVDGGWGAWSAWSACSAGCGGGFRRRSRACDSPRPVNGGRPCLGCDVEYGECESSCPTVRRLTDWTPWLAANDTAGRKQQRFRFACRAAVADPDLIRVSQVKVDERYCRPDGHCSPANSVSLGWGEWSAWSECSVPCGGGVQVRSRVCEGDAALCRSGPHRMERECNAHSCEGEWSCWSEWSQCSVSCGVGHRRRSRVCRNRPASSDAGAICEGHDVAQEACEMPSCTSMDGWLEWTVWSQCDENDEQHRLRRCNTSEPGPRLCQGHDRETRMCVHNSRDRLQLAATGGGSTEGAIGPGILVMGCVLSFLLGAGLAAGAMYYFMARRRRRFDKAAQLFSKPTPPKTAAAKTAVANQYVTLPGARRGAPGVHELAELKNGYRRPGSPTKTVMPPPMAPLTPKVLGSASTIRRSGGNRYDPLSTQELHFDLGLDSDNMY
ncbi:semaphorin-5B-like [Amphibalanus amphitrite]|uniref:semaphorin-5B-like n=1 Tax=Amphibalanus amphitrite TaxID=1232801 RepID=UPI001C9239F7|nr:semaphorin-5B-like [Amphibalanus amphitrite]